MTLQRLPVRSAQQYTIGVGSLDVRRVMTLRRTAGVGSASRVSSRSFAQSSENGTRKRKVVFSGIQPTGM